MNDATIDEFCAECDSAYEAKTGKKMAGVGIDPISLITIFLSILAALCPKPPAALKAAAAAKSPETMLRAYSAMRQALMEEHPGVLAPMLKFNGKALTHAALDTFATKDEAKIQYGLDCCAR